MDPLGGRCRDVIQLEDMVPWQKTSEVFNSGSFSASLEKDLLSSMEELSERDLLAPEYPLNEKLNLKIYLINGDVTRLSVQAVILPVFDILNQNSLLHSNLLHSAGPRFIEACRPLTKYRVGEVRVHHGYDLPARYAVHVVEPMYNPKFPSAADNALHICYRSALQICTENEFRRIAISPLHITRSGFPPKEGCNIALRTIRKCLEVLEPKFDAVAIVTDPTVAEMYSKLYPAYFPRSNIEAQNYFKFLPKDVSCNQWGEVMKQERAIRIADISEIKQRLTVENDKAERSNISESAVCGGRVAVNQELVPQTFAQLSGDHDKKRNFVLQNSATQQNLEVQQRIYKRLLRISRNENFSHFSDLNAVKVSGNDATGNRVMVIIGRQLKFSELDLEKFLLYLIFIFDPVVNEPYTVVYFHTQTRGHTRPSTAYLRRLFNTFDQRYKTNLARLCIVHMSTLTRFKTWVFMTLNTGMVRDRIVNVRTVPDLYKIVAPDQIDIPPFVLSYDMKANPHVYNDPPATQRNGSGTDFNRVAPGTL